VTTTAPFLVTRRWGRVPSAHGACYPASAWLIQFRAYAVPSFPCCVRPRCHVSLALPNGTETAPTPFVHLPLWSARLVPPSVPLAHVRVAVPRRCLSRGLRCLNCPELSFIMPVRLVCFSRPRASGLVCRSRHRKERQQEGKNRKLDQVVRAILVGMTDFSVRLPVPADLLLWFILHVISTFLIRSQQPCHAMPATPCLAAAQA
jgi:hypothetical protein